MLFLYFYILTYRVCDDYYQAHIGHVTYIEAKLKLEFLSDQLLFV